MRDAGAARRYATAIVELAVEAGSEADVLSDLTTWDTLLTGEGSELFHVLSSPVFSVEERRAVMAAFAEKLGTSDLVVRFLSLLIDRERFGAMHEVVRFVTDDLDARAGRMRVQVRSAVALDAGMRDELAAAFAKATGKTIVLEAEVEPELLGGVVARLGSKVYDASLRTRLQELKHRLIHAQAPAEA